MRIGLFGGSFDPVHNGHLLLAECCSDAAQLDEVWLTPSAVQPLKPHGPVATDVDRLAMLRLAVEGRPGLVVSTHEIDRGGVSYTVDTLRELRSERPDDEFFFLMGADSLHDLPKWREPEQVVRLATPLVVHRAGEPEPDFDVIAPWVDAQRLALIRDSVVAMPPTPISSSALRGKARAGESLIGFTPESVADYADKHSLYR